MKTYYETVNGNSISLESPEQAKEHVEEQMPGCVFAEQWDDFGPSGRRLLVWENEEDSVNDTGQNAIGQIIVIDDF